MNIAEWILVIMLSVTLFVFLVAGIVLIIKLIHLANEAQKIVITGQGIAAKADDIVDNVKGMTTVGGIVKTFANRVMENQERRYAEEDAMREAEQAAAAEGVAGAAREDFARRAAAVKNAEEKAAGTRAGNSGRAAESKPTSGKTAGKTSTKK